MSQPFERWNDLRGAEHRSVRREDVVVITGAEYLRKGRSLIELAAERDKALADLAVAREEAIREVCTWLRTEDAVIHTSHLADAVERKFLPSMKPKALLSAVVARS